MPTGGNPNGGGGGGGSIDEFGKAFGGNTGGGGGVGIPTNPWGSGGFEGWDANGVACTSQKMSYAQLIIKIRNSYFLLPLFWEEGHRA